MLNHTNIKATEWSRNTFKRLWRGDGSWKWSFSWKGCKWQNARSGWWVPAWFEGGQTPLFRRMPKARGFSNSLFKKSYEVVNLNDIDFLIQKGIDVIDSSVLFEHKIVRKKDAPVKLLWNGILSKKVNIKIHKASNSAKEAVEKAGWTLELLPM
jgi:large subunit ribosomal protein L15